MCRDFNNLSITLFISNLLSPRTLKCISVNITWDFFFFTFLENCLLFKVCENSTSELSVVLQNMCSWLFSACWGIFLPDFLNLGETGSGLWIFAIEPFFQSCQIPLMSNFSQGMMSVQSATKSDKHLGIAKHNLFLATNNNYRSVAFSPFSFTYDLPIHSNQN